MDSSEIELPIIRLSGASFHHYTSNEIKALSVKEITNFETFDKLLHPTFGGLHDPALGPAERDDVCSTCGQNSIFCPGHFGHICLPLPVVNPILSKSFLSILRGSCFKCHRVLVKDIYGQLFISQMELVGRSHIAGVWKLREFAEELAHKEGLFNVKDSFDSFVKENFPDEEDRAADSDKNVEAIRSELVNGFLKRYMDNTRMRCPHCSNNNKQIQAKNMRIYHYSLKDLKEKKSEQNASAKRKNANKKYMEEYVVMDEDVNSGDEEKLKSDKNDDPMEDSSSTTLITPSAAKEHLRCVWKKESAILKILFQALGQCKDSEYPTDIFFVDILPVTPSRFRPILFRNDLLFENRQTTRLKEVLFASYKVREILQEIEKTKKIDQSSVEFAEGTSVAVRGQTMNHTLQNAWLRLQSVVNGIVDKDQDKLSEIEHPGIKQLLEKKKGLLRSNMMGKRVNFAARTVITPDPCIATNEIGFPEVFAKKLTYPQPVTPWNFQELKQAVINGPDVYPGAAFVEYENGHRVRLLANDRIHREAIAKQLLTPSVSSGVLFKPKTVLRHLKNGDYLLLNRQPTLHKSSVQAHKARVLPGVKTLRLHYSNCKAYNADFDGDEMNAHFPQNELCRSEACTIAFTDLQYLGAKDGIPLGGLIQDHMVSGVSLTVRGRFFERADYFHLLYSALSDKSGHVKILPPALIKPVKLWSGKQVLSSVLLNIIPKGQKPLNLEGKSKIEEKSWVQVKNEILVRLAKSGCDLGESRVVIQDGELLQGVLDKGHYGPTPFGLVHSCYELYGGEVAGKLLSCLGRLFRIFLQIRGFTLGVEDILVMPKADKKRAMIVKESTHCGRDVIATAFDLDLAVDDCEILKTLKEARFQQDDQGMRELDLVMKSNTDEVQNNVVRTCMSHNLKKTFPSNNLQLMVQSGAKGSSVNCMQISCLLGQIELEGKRPRPSLSGRTLPSFLPYDLSPRAGGFVTGRFLTGIPPQEYFFHCMAGREGLIDTAVKTSRSGYLQRCLVKHLEGIMVSYDLTVRDSDGSVIQFYYGEDSLDVPKTLYLVPEQFPFLVVNRDIVESHAPVEENGSVSKKVKKLTKKIAKWKKKHQGFFKEKKRKSAFLTFYNCEVDGIADPGDKTCLDESKPGRSVAATKVISAWTSLDEQQKQKYAGHTPCPDPVMCKFRPTDEAGVMSEKLQKVISTYCEDHFDEEAKQFHFEDFGVKDFKRMINKKILQSLVQPGECVGPVCAQSVGEPSTQMTLNTFHFAGRGEMNVTLGIPRLREILMCASENIKTPSMDIPVYNTPSAIAEAKKIQNVLNRILLSQVLQEVKVVEYLSLATRSKVERARIFQVRFQFLPPAAYKNTSCLTPSDILNFMETTYFTRLITLVERKMDMLNLSKLCNTGKIQRFEAPEEEEEEQVIEEGDVSDKEEPNDGDATSTKWQEQQKESVEYVGEDQEREEIEEEESDDGDDVNVIETPEISSEDETTCVETRPLKQPKVSAALRIKNVCAKNPLIANYKFDTKKESWCEVTLRFSLLYNKIDMVSLIKDHVKTVVLHEVPGISCCFLSRSKSAEDASLHLKTEGINIKEMLKYADVLDLNHLRCNNIKAFSEIYGIEAAAKVLLMEIRSVFAAYGIEVDYRHLSLLADYMTHEGVYKAFNRSSFATNPSPFQKMSFETALAFLIDASIHNKEDTLKSPSSRLVTGQVVTCGTGSFEIRQPLV